MLNTGKRQKEEGRWFIPALDLHNSAINKKNKMKKEEFIKNLKGINEGKDFNQQMLE